MQRVAALAVAAMCATACGSSGLLRQYEYEEDIYLALDGAATVYTNASLAALDALRGVSFATGRGGRVDRRQVRELFTTPVTRVQSVRTSRRRGRQFVHVRLEVPDIRRLGEAAPFAWSTYQFDRDEGVYVFKQAVGRAAGNLVGDVGWDGRELVAFRLHLPSRIVYHNAGAANLRRGNILVWEQSLDERRRGTPVTIDARMQTQSILYRTLSLFGATFVVVAATFGVVIWRILRHKGR